MQHDRKLWDRLRNNSKGIELNSVRFMIYYGVVEEQALHGLKEYDLVIVEPLHWALGQIRELQAAGTRVIGYISVMEWPSWNVKRGESLQLTDYLLLKGNRIYYQEWDSYMMDIRETHYRDLLMDEIHEQIGKKSMDGIFLDTVGDIENHLSQPLVHNELIHSYLTLLKDIRSTFPHLWMLQNRGFQFIELAARYLDGFMWEDWREDSANDPWVKHQLNMLQPLRKAGLQLFALDSSTGSDFDGRIARYHGFNYLLRNSEYTAWPEG